MNAKSVFSKILAGILGMIVLNEIVLVSEIILITIYFILWGPESIGKWLWIIYALINIVTLIAGIILGLRSYKAKNTWYYVFKPSRHKAILSAVLSIVFVIILLIINKGGRFVHTYTSKPVSAILAIPLLLLSLFISFYPFSALCQATREFKKDKSLKKSKSTIIILLVLINPIFVYSSAMLEPQLREIVLKEPCGLEIVAFDEPSAAKDAGMQIGEVIIQINGLEIKSVNDLNEHKDTYDSPASLIIQTRTGSYQVTPYLKDGRYVIGVNLTNDMCERSIRRALS